MQSAADMVYKLQWILKYRQNVLHRLCVIAYMQWISRHQQQITAGSLTTTTQH